MARLKHVQVDSHEMIERLRLDFEGKSVAVDFNQAMSAEEVAAQLRALAEQLDPQHAGPDRLESVQASSRPAANAPSAGRSD